MELPEPPYFFRAVTDPVCEPVMSFPDGGASAGKMRIRFSGLPECYFESVEIVDRKTGEVVYTIVVLERVRAGEHVSILFEPDESFIHRAARALMLGDEELL